MEQFLGAKEDKVNYLKGLIRMAKVDGKVLESEKEYYSSVINGMNLSDSEVDSLNDLWESTNEIDLSFTSKKEALFFIQSAIQISMVDEDYDVTDKKEIRKIADELNVESTAVSAIEAWVEEGLAWRKKGEDIISSYCS